MHLKHISVAQCAIYAKSKSLPVAVVIIHVDYIGIVDAVIKHTGFKNWLVVCH